MPTIQSYPNGMSIYQPSPSGAPSGAKRGAVNGWSAGAVSRHRKWLWSVDTGNLTGFGYGVTLTVRVAPPTSAEWHRLRLAWWKRMKRLGAVRWHWVVEWTRRGVPHLHAAVYFDQELSPSQVHAMRSAWCDIAQGFGALEYGQYVVPIHDADGWAKYCAKHAGRTSSHYQRQGSGPAHWETTGRLWGHGGDWPTRRDTLWVDRAGYAQLRRLVRSWRIASARSENDPETRKVRELAARRMLQRDLRSSGIWGVAEWVPEATQAQMLSWLLASGFDVRDFPPPEPPVVSEAVSDA